MTETEKMIRSIEALLDLDARGALVPHGVGGLARWLLSQCAELLAKPAEQPQGEPVAWEVYWADNGEYYFTSRKRERAAKLIADPDFKIVPLYAERADPGEVERLRHQDAQMRAASSSLRIQLERAKSQLAERDALLREWLKVPLEVSSPEINDLRRKSDYLTASADPEARS